jgi:hypothetical protein
MLTKRLTAGAALLTTLTLAGPPEAGAGAAVPPEPTAAPAPGRPRACYLAGKRATNGNERRRQFADGIAAARALLAVQPDDSEGLLWLAANLGADALERGVLTALKVLPEMERLLLRLEARDPMYDHAAAARTLGVLYFKAPALISIGSKSRARDFLERALLRAGDHPANQILAAEFFADVGEEARARSLAESYLRAPASETENPDAADWRQVAIRIVGARR